MKKNPLLNYQHFYLVGIKGVAMTGMACMLVQAKKNVGGTDVAENYVTKKLLDSLSIKLDVGFQHQLPANIDAVIYTAAHKGIDNPLVKQAIQKNIPIFSHAEALAGLFNEKKGIAVCGVGGKSTVSAMIAWIFSRINREPSYSVGVGSIPGLPTASRWNQDSEFFIAEADEYVIDAAAPSKGEEITPRFSFLRPHTTVCTHLLFDHPDVYRDFDHTVEVFQKFFYQIQDGGTLIMRDQDAQYMPEQFEKNILTFGTSEQADFMYSLNSATQQGKTFAKLLHDSTNYTIELQVPGEYNVENATAAIAACYAVGIDVHQSITALESFASTQRRYEYKGEYKGIKLYDDYAHHPDELSAVIKATYQWFDSERVTFAFQPHTYSRTKQLFPEFVTALSNAKKLVLIDIFASAREQEDHSVSSNLLAESITQAHPDIQVRNVKTIDSLYNFVHDHLSSGDVFITLGAGDIYEVHDMLLKKQTQ